MQYYAGIDLGARRSHLCIIDDEGSIVLRCAVENGRGEILRLLGPYLGTIRVAIESTFNWYWLADSLMTHDVDVRLVHTLGLKAITSAKVKTDRRDAHTLARLLRLDELPEGFIYPRSHRGVRDLVRRRNQLVRTRANAFGSISRLLLRHGHLDHNRNSVPQLSKDDLDDLLRDPNVSAEARFELERIRLYSAQLVRLEDHILEETRERFDADFQRVKSLPGVGVFLGLTILFETGPIERFSSSRRYSSYCRLVPGVYQSGSVKRRRGAQSKQGNPHLKWAYNQAAMFAVRYHPGPKRCFEHHLDRHAGPAGRVVVYNTVAHKLAVAAYRMLKDQTYYNEELAFGR